MSFAEDMGYDAYDAEDDSLEHQWSSGYHTTKNGDRIELSLMTDMHIENTIIMFEKTHDVSELKKELRKREIIRSPFMP